MDISVTPKGQTLESLIRRAERNLRTANRKVTAPVRKAGVKAIKSGSPTFRGKQLTAKTEVHNSGSGALVTFYGTPAGAWTIKETGADAHLIRPRKAQALKFPGAGRKGKTGFTMSANHPGIAGQHAWTKARPRLEGAVGPVIEDVYTEALT